MCTRQPPPPRKLLHWTHIQRMKRHCDEIDVPFRVRPGRSWLLLYGPRESSMREYGVTPRFFGAAPLAALDLSDCP